MSPFNPTSNGRLRAGISLCRSTVSRPWLAWVFLAAAPLAAGLVGCANPASPATLYRLRSEPPVALPAAQSPPKTTAPVASVAAVTWQLMLPVRVPSYLDRDALLLPQGHSGLVPLAGHRWAEPLQDGVSRVLRQDLATLLGDGRLWTAPLPEGLRVRRQLRVELLAFEVSDKGQAVRLDARWTVLPVGAGFDAGTNLCLGAATVEQATLHVPSAGGDIDNLVSAHRLALWRLAERVAADLAAVPHLYCVSHQARRAILAPVCGLGEQTVSRFPAQPSTGTDCARKPRLPRRLPNLTEGKAGRLKYRGLSTRHHHARIPPPLRPRSPAQARALAAPSGRNRRGHHHAVRRRPCAACAGARAGVGAGRLHHAQR